MGKNSEQKNNNSIIDQERARQSTEHNQFMSMATPRRDSEQSWADDTRNKIMGGYEGLYKNATGPTDMFGGTDGKGGSGGYSAATYNPQTAAIERATASHAGLSGYVGESADTARVLAKGGEWDPRIREGYGNLANNGGYSDTDVSNIRNRAASSSPAFYESVRNRMAQKARASGGNLGSIMGAASDRMTRESARGAADNSLNAELGLQDRIREGKLSGLTGLTGLDTSMNNFRGQGMSGLLGAGNAENDINMFNAGADNQTSMFNAGQGNDMNRYNTGILNEAAQYNASAQNSAASSSAAAAERLRSDRVKEYMAGLGGMQDMYGSTPAELARQEELMMRERFGNTGNIGDNISQRITNNPKGPSTMDRIMQGAGLVGGVAGAWLGA